MTNEIKIVAAVLSHIRGEMTASCVADLFGVTEAQVQGWKDVFQVAGTVTLMNSLKSDADDCETLNLGSAPATMLMPRRFAAGEPTTEEPLGRFDQNLPTTFPPA